MGILEKYGSNPEQLNERVTRDDIALEIKDLLNDIEYIEQKHGTVLIGERSNLDKPYIDCRGMTRAECAHLFSTWRNNIYSRYSGK